MLLDKYKIPSYIFENAAEVLDALTQALAETLSVTEATPSFINILPVFKT
jgi:hypothetical protein